MEAQTLAIKFDVSLLILIANFIDFYVYVIDFYCYFIIVCVISSIPNAISHFLLYFDEC